MQFPGEQDITWNNANVTDMLSELELPNFRTVFTVYVHKFNQRWLTSVNGAVRHFIRSRTFSL